MKLYLTLTCPDTIGLIFKVSQFLATNECNILQSNQWTDESNNTFFMRVEFDSRKYDLDYLLKKFEHIAIKYHMVFQIWNSRKMKLLVLVSKFDHCLADILYKTKNNHLNVEITGVVSNHETAKALCDWYNVPFYHLPVSHENRDVQEDEIYKLYKKNKVDLMILARYMQVLSPCLCNELYGKIINVHHGAVESFPGKNPYGKAHNRGVKQISSTCHMVSEVLDGGPIVEQETIKIDHTFNVEKLISAGRDLECRVLSTGIQLFSEHRIFVNGNKTVVFK